jgi:hypothetical protein
MANGELERPAPGHWWTFGFEDHPGQIKMRESTSGLVG